MEIIPALVLGACTGSFLTALTYRLPKGISTTKGRSICPHCKTQIAWYDNIPLVSFVLLKGKCRNCGKKIALRYPLIELGTILLFLIFFLYLSRCPNIGTESVICSWKATFGSLSYLFGGIIVSILIAIFAIDLEHKIIPDQLIFFGVFTVFSFLLFANPSVLFNRFLAGFSVATFFLVVHLLTKGRGMGLGDVKFVILGGLLLGWTQSLVWLFLSFTAGAIIGVILILLKKAKFGREIAFGPYLVGALIITILFGERILRIYG